MENITSARNPLEKEKEFSVHLYSLHLVSITELMPMLMERFFEVNQEFRISSHEQDDVYDWIIREAVDRYLRSKYMTGVVGHYSYDIGKIVYDYVESIMISRVYPKLDMIFKEPILCYKVKVMVINDIIVIGK